MHNWQDHEIRELLRIRAHEQFRGQITGTVKDAVVFSTIARLLAQQGVHRSRDQVVSKLKNLKKQYRNYKEQISAKGGDRSAAYWPFFEEAERAFGDHPLPAEPPDSLAPITERLDSAPVPASAPVRNQRAAFDQDEAEQVVVGNWGEQSQGPTPNQGTKREQAPVEEDEDEEYGSPEEPVQSTCGIPTKKRKTTILHQVNSMINATMSKLREMDAAMQAQEDVRLKRLMDHEKDMQKSLIQEMLALHRTVSAENHQRHLELVDRVTSRVPPSSSQGGL
ncbi:uncharacterized protein LOC110156028 [Boleophthalmus pectinirostris]|uniref:uncharacterized protein LOC110156028 n=1 Tax=Boleophthalmus pectinirostris TaxID=150288 RepID=UPI000A1C207C|nr:uncharacterized protein LOC110156028 [Boleophthalmus pectinirostris]